MKTANDIKHFVEASNPKRLQREMLRNNIKTKSYHDYQIIFDGKTWYAWYEWSSDNLLKEESEKQHQGQRV